MVKLKKALKKLATLRGKPAQAAKKATPVKKKTVSVAAKKGATSAKKAAPAKKAAAKAAPKGKAPAKAAKGTEKKGKEALKAKSAPTTAKAAKGTEKVAGKKAEAPKKADKLDKAAKDQAQAVEEVKAKGRKRGEPEVAPEPEEEVVLLDAEGRRYCRVKDCDQAAMVDGYCRYHYLLFWKNIQIRKKILTEGKLERYIEELTARYPDKYLDMLRKDLRSDKEFMAAIQELEIDEAAVDGEFEDEAQSYLDEVRGMGPEGATTERDEDF